MATAFIGGIGIPEIIIILVVALIIFGRRLPDVAKQMGKGYMEFRKGLSNIQNEMDYTEAVPLPKEPAAPQEPKPPKAVSKKPKEASTDKALDAHPPTETPIPTKTHVPTKTPPPPKTEGGGDA